MPADTQAPPAPPAPAAPARTGTVAPTSTATIHVAPPAEPAAPPAKGSARDRMFADLRKKAKPADGSTPEPEPTAPPTDGTEPVSSASGAEPSAPTSDTPPKDGSVTPADDKGAKPKVNPWKLVDEWKKKHGELEKTYSDLKTLVPDEKARKTEIERLTKAETRVKELEDEIRFVNYEKSPEFKQKFEEPYEKAWVRAMNEIKEVSIYDEDRGTERLVTAQDLLELVNLPLPKARELANQKFGDFADDIMAHRKEVRNLFEAKQSALEDAKTNGSKREAELTQQMQEKQAEIVKTVTDTWKQANEAAVADEKVGKLFAPVEGDEDGNSRLARGYELVDRAFSENPMDPRLTPQQRAEVVKRHAAVRNRAAAFGRLVASNTKLQTKVAELTNELEQFKATVPATVGATPQSDGQGGSSAWSAVRAGLQKLAK